MFRRRRSAPTDAAAAVSEFWSAWPELRDQIAADLDAGKPPSEDARQRLSDLARRIHPSLVCEISQTEVADHSELAGLDISDFSETVLEDLARLDSLDSENGDTAADTSEAASPAGSGRFALTLTAGADDTGRILAERWRQAAPADEDWRFYPARQADPDRLTGLWTWDGHEFDLSHASVSLRVDQSNLKIDAAVFHPDNMFLAGSTQEALAKHVVTLAVGEDDMVRWIGAITALTEKPLDPLPPTTMPSVVQQLLSAFGGVKWVKAQGRIPLAGTFQIGMRYPLHRRDFPAFTLYVQVTVAYANSGSDKLPAKKSAEALERFGATLQKALGSHGAVLAQRTMGGQRQYHVYLDPDSGALSALEEAVNEWTEGRGSLSSFTDPDWAAINQFTRPLRKKLGGESS